MGELQGPLISLKNLKVVIVGDGGTGKTSFLQRHVYGQNHKIYEPHTGVVVYPVRIKTDLGRFSFNCWDTPKQDMFLQDVHYNGSDCAIIMFDVTSRLSYKNVPKWYRALRRVCDDIPIVLCGNKVDVKDRKVKAKQVTFHRKENLTYFEISAKSNYNLHQPFLHLFRNLPRYKNVRHSPWGLEMQESRNTLEAASMFAFPGFRARPALFPPEVRIDMEAQMKNEQVLAEALKQPLPPDDDDAFM